MIVRCGRCRSGFDVPGPGRHVCPTCGTANDVRSPGPIAPPPPPPPPAHPSPRARCAACDFSFIVGPVAVAPCPNCGAAVTVEPAQEDPE